jgi:hypothetical protein
MPAANCRSSDPPSGRGGPYARWCNGVMLFRFRRSVCDTPPPVHQHRIRMFLTNLPWLQMSGAIAGGLVGSFSGFIANSFHEHRVRRRVRRNVACALIGEMQTLTQYIEDNYLVLLRRSIEAAASAEGQMASHHYFRGDRDYMPVYRAIGATVGFLPTPLPRDLISWYHRSDHGAGTGACAARPVQPGGRAIRRLSAEPDPRAGGGPSGFDRRVETFDRPPGDAVGGRRAADPDGGLR